MNNPDKSPWDANAQQHINFINSDKAATGRSLSSDENEQSTAKQWEEMREEKKNNNLDPSQGSPQDANTQKHINFVDMEQEGTSQNVSSDEDEQSPAKQQWEEMREEKKNNNIDPSLQSPQDANTQKHINFLETEEE